MTRNQRDRVQLALGIVICCGFFVVLGLMIAHDTPGKDILIGALAAAFGTVVMYFYGTSDSSRHKTDLLAQAPPIEDKS